MYSSRPDEKGHECRTNGARSSLRKRLTIGRPFIAALTDRDLSTVVLRHLEHRNLLWQRKLQHTERNKLHEHPQITGAVARQFLRGHSLYQLRDNAPLAIAERLYRALRWTKQAGLPWLLLGLLVCTPIVHAQIAAPDRQAVEIVGALFVEGRNRP